MRRGGRAPAFCWQRGAGVRPKRSDFPRRFGAVSGLSVVSCTVFARNAWKPRRFGRLPDPQAAASLAYGASDSVESFGEVPFGVAVVQHHLGMRLSLLQPRTVEVRGPDRAGYRFALRGGTFLARSFALEQGPADRPQGHQNDDRCGPADRRNPQGAAHVRFVPHVAHRRIDHRHDHATAGAAYFRGARYR